ncbi:MAG: aminomethyl-transferring glycine dehydrogenase [Bacteroidales bacterium]|nr:aminomethyl-transferring glycine dehydrogenase [Bacteroidales bacterium]MBN2819152.1 aminomethyl-transferring glycine dehydrogenase [Bacteroidales bacterium]
MAAENFIHRHLGPRETDVNKMLQIIGLPNLDELINKTVPPSIRFKSPIDLPAGINEYEYFKSIRKLASKNKVFKSYIGMGYYHTVFPAVIQRNILENPSWYTSYTPYQAEISQGRLEALLNFQTVITELTGFEVANASLLDEATAVAEAMAMLYNARSRSEVKEGLNVFFVDENIFPQNWAVIQTRAESLGIVLEKGNFKENALNEKLFGAFVQYPAGDGSIQDYTAFIEKVHVHGAKLIMATDIMSLVMLTPPGELGADAVVGSAQRFGIPMGYGGPHAAFLATKEEFKRFIPGRIIGVSKDKFGNLALRMALQTREQHIKREKATSNICTAQALLANMAGMYAIYHGPEGLSRIATHCHQTAGTLSDKLADLGFINKNQNFFDTLRIKLPEGVTQKDIRIHALEREINLRYFNDGDIGISVDETTSIIDLNKLVEVFAATKKMKFSNIQELKDQVWFEHKFARKGAIMQQPIFNSYRSETELMRYIKRLEHKDISLTHSMISLGSCTMKLNAAVEMLALSWPEIGEIHPFVPLNQTEGYQQLFHELGKTLLKITGFEAISFQPNSGAAGEYAGLLVIKKFHEANGQKKRDVVLIPASAHGTNPASAVMAGYRVEVVNCDDKGNIDINDLKDKAEKDKENLAAFMVTYPSTHGVFEPDIKEMIEIIHKNGGQVYMDGANMNAQVGLTSPAEIGADVCHLNLHKTFAIPHGGGGPGVGPICVAGHLVEFLPAHPIIETGGVNGMPAVAAAPYGSASILTISHAYCNMLGADGLTLATKLAILNANYIAARLNKYYPVLYTGKTGYIAHEMILDCRPFKQKCGVTETDIAKRLIDYGFHAPTLSFPVHGTLMVEPTESESKEELDRFIDAMIAIYYEMEEIEKSGDTDNPLLNAPHTLEEVTADEWNHSYSREKAAFPVDWLKGNKYWPPVARIDNAYGDRNLMCTCPTPDDFR